MKRYTVHLTRSIEYTCTVMAEDVDDAKAAAEGLPLRKLKRGGDGIEAWDAYSKPDAWDEVTA